jgi:hypothetical protein
MQTPWKKTLPLVVVLLLAACTGQSAGVRTTLIPYNDPGGTFSMTYPQGWSVAYDKEVNSVTFTPEGEAGAQFPLSVKAIAMKTASDAWDKAGEEINQVLEQFLKSFFPDESPEVYNTSDLTVGKQPALVMDFAKPVENGYYKGSIVLVILRGYAIGFVGGADGETWDAFLPTFKQMLLDVSFVE